MKKYLFPLIILALFITSPALGQDIRNLSAALHHAAEHAAPASKITPKSPHIAKMTRQGNLITAIIQTEKKRYSQHNKQIIFENGVYKGTSQTRSFAKNGYVSITYNPAKFELYAVYSRAGGYNPQLPFMLSEVSSSSMKYDVSDFLIAQYGSGDDQTTVFYFLIPKSLPGRA